MAAMGMGNNMGMVSFSIVGYALIGGVTRSSPTRNTNFIVCTF